MNLSTLLLISAAPAVLLGADRMSVGLTRTKKVIEAYVVPGASLDVATVLLIGGVDGDENAVRVVTRELNRYMARKQSSRAFRLLVIPLANPDKVRLAFPPAGRAYKENPESHYLWRWIGMQAPDLVVIAGEDDGGLAEALSNNAVAGVGRIPAHLLIATAGLIGSLPAKSPKSEAQSEIRRRIARTPQQVAEELAQYYGHDEFKEAVYIGAMSLIGQIRLGHLAEVERAVAPFVNGSKDSLAKATSSHLAGHLIFAELAERTGDKRYVELVKKAADLGFTDAGAMRESMPLHNEMSDAVFMGCPILAAAGKLTHDRKYWEMALRHLQFMQKLCLRSDGLYRHSPLDPAAWGRGNAFPALGLALTLSRLPPEDPAFPAILQSYRAHMNTLARYQDENGMWRQVIDLPGSYPEFSATAMIATAMLRGIRAGWIDASRYQPMVDKAWTAIKARTSPDGTLVDVCESTGKQPSLDDYLNRLAILDRDPRGGGMALLLATEMAGLR
jgi:unsaturated rhamnogalacturonyl hydrolase